MGQKSWLSFNQELAQNKQTKQNEKKKKNKKKKIACLVSCHLSKGQDLQTHLVPSIYSMLAYLLCAHVVSAYIPPVMGGSLSTKAVQGSKYRGPSFSYRAKVCLLEVSAQRPSPAPHGSSELA